MNYYYYYYDYYLGGRDLAYGYKIPALPVTSPPDVFEAPGRVRKWAQCREHRDEPAGQVLCLLETSHGERTSRCQETHMWLQ